VPQHTRTTIQFHPVTIEQRAVIDYGTEIVETPIIGWAVILVVGESPIPTISVEPVIEDDCHGAISVGDLIDEGDAAELVEIR
jgi:hypothetical protein